MDDGDARRVAVVTGGGGAIGAACGRALRARGYDVLLTSRTPATLRAAAEEIGARWVAADCAEPESFAAVVEAAGRIDLLVHSAGILRGTFVRRESLADFDAVIRTNLRSALVVVQAVLPAMGVGGRIVFVSSSAGQAPMRGRAAYSASKAALNAFADVLGQELARDGIHVNVLVPAPVDTPMLDGVTFDMHAIAPQDVADALCFLDALPARVEVGPIALRAVSTGPLAPAPITPAGRAR